MVEPLTRVLEHLTSWHGPWRGHRAVVVGLGATGFAVVDTLIELGVEVSVVAEHAEDDVVHICHVLGATVLLEPDPVKRSSLVTSEVDFAVISPGVSPSDAAVTALARGGVPLLSDVDFSWRVRDKNGVEAPWVVVSGDTHLDVISNLASRILRADNRAVGVAGLGAPPLLDLLRDPVAYELLLLRASVDSLRWWGGHEASGREPDVSVLVDDDLPLSAGVIYEGTKSACIYRRGAGLSESLVENADVVEGARAIGVGLDSPGMSDLGVVEGIVCDRAFLEDRRNQALEISTVEELEEAGWDIPHAMPAILAAVAIARAYDVSPALIAGVVSLP